ncbi:MAG: phosphate ABC transporter permease PstA [Candidatus Nanopelagicales bacterium]|jgi:phosphate transport system permease protein|nr:phosphate ABC transporter permease PstA [Candidatus Nanopelagicales bacterium]
MPAPTEKYSPEVKLAGRRASNSDTNKRSLVFLGLLWFSLLVAFGFLVVLLVTTFLDGIGRYDLRMFTNYNNTTPEDAGARAGILGSIMVIAFTALMAIPIGVGAALYLEEFSHRDRWYNRLFELNIQNLAAVPAILYGLLTLGLMAAMGFAQTDIVFGGALALALLILPVIIITTREALRAVPQEIRDGSLALGATQWQTAWKQTLPAATPGIATGTILALSRAMGEAAPLLLLGVAVYISFDPNGLLSQFTTLPIQIFNWTSAPQEEFKTLAAATSILLLAILLAMNGIAIYIRNKFAKRW